MSNQISFPDSIYMDNTFNHSGTPFITTHQSYPGSPSMSTTSTPPLSTGSPSPSPSIEMNGFFNSPAAKYFCPMKGCMYSAAVGFSSTEELCQHMALMCHLPETQPVLKSQMTSMMDFDSSPTAENTEDWLAVQHCIAPGALSNSTPQNNSQSPMYAFTFTYGHKAQSPPATTSRCDCHHCQFQGNWAYPSTNSPIQRSNSNKRKSGVYDIPTPLTIQMPQPPMIINLPTPPPPPSSKLQQLQPPPPPPPNSNQYALWQQQIQIAQVTEMLRAQKRQRETQRRNLEETSPSREHTAVPRISQEAYSFLRPTYYPASR